MYNRLVVCFLVVATITGCVKQPDDVEPIADHPEFVGEWKNMNPEIRENERRFASMLTIDAEGDCSFEGGLQNTYGSFGYKNNSVYISGRALKVLQEPRKLYWVAYVAEPELDYATHCMKLRESKRAGSDPDMFHEMVKKDLPETDGVSFFNGLDTLWSGSDADHEVVFSHDMSGETKTLEVRITGAALNDTLRFKAYGDVRFFEDGELLQVVDQWTTIRFQKDGNDLLFGYRSADDHYSIFEQQPGLIEELLLTPGGN
jgi:hypothetical protein